MSNPTLKNRVSIYGRGLGEPLFQTDDARLVQVYDADGELSAMFVRLTDALWGFTARGDEDWEAHKKNVSVDETKSAEDGVKS